MSGFEEDQDKVHYQFYHYDFDNSEEYKKGLQQVYDQFLLMQSEQDLNIAKDIENGKFDYNKITAVQKSQLSLQAKVYFFCTINDVILNLDDYEKWKRNYEKKLKEEKERPKIAEAKTVQEKEEKKESEPPYSSNYEELVDLIVNNKPVPGIKQIPNIVLDPSTASSHTMKERPKPWEKGSKEPTDEKGKDELESPAQV